MVRPRRWLCSCPDHSKRLNEITTLSQSWAEFSRDWSRSNAGATEDCKHIMNGKLIRGINVGPFKDEPIESRNTSTFDTTKRNNFTFKRPKGFNK